MRKNKYCGLNDVIRDWNLKAICVEFKDGSDAQLQENYSVEDAIYFAGEGCRFFYD